MIDKNSKRVSNRTMFKYFNRIKLFNEWYTVLLIVLATVGIVALILSILSLINNKGPEGKQGDKGEIGISCWDTNQNGICDHTTEDLNLDSKCNVDDCNSIHSVAKLLTKCSSLNYLDLSPGDSDLLSTTNVLIDNKLGLWAQEPIRYLIPSDSDGIWTLEYSLSLELYNCTEEEAPISFQMEKNGVAFESRIIKNVNNNEEFYFIKLAFNINSGNTISLEISNLSTECNIRSPSISFPCLFKLERYG